MKKLIRWIAKKMGYTYSVKRITPDEVTGVPYDPVKKVCERYKIPICATVESPEQYPEAGPLLPEPTVAKLPAEPLKHYAGLEDALVDNVSITRYFSAEKKNDDVVLTDALPEHHYIYRQKRILAGLKDVLGVENLSGLRVLDIGCSSGYFTFSAGKMGAKEVLGIDARPEHADQFAILQATLPPLPMCRFETMDMERGMEALKEPFDVVFSMGVMYHTFDHVRFAENMYRLTDKVLYLAGQCSGRPDMMCEAVIEDRNNLRASVHGPALFPSVAWMAEVLRWVGFSKVFYQPLPKFQPLPKGGNPLTAATLIALK